MKLSLGKRVDATQNGIIRGIIIYAIPLVISALIQNAFNAVDLAVLGQMANEEAVAAIGTTSSIVYLFLNAFIGMSNGAKMIMSRLFGEKNADGIKNNADTVMSASVGFGIIASVIAFFVAPDLLIATNCPPECLTDAVLYTRVYLLASPAILLYNSGSSVIMAAGDSQRPLVYVFIGGIVNVVLNIILCLILPNKVAAVAIATATSQIVMAGLVIYRLCTMDGEYRLKINQLTFKFAAFIEYLKQGVPLAITQMLYPFANILVFSEVNVFGVAAAAGNVAASTIDGFISPFIGAFNSTLVVFMGQNIGAKKYNRVEKSFKDSMLLSSIISLILGIGIYLTGEIWCQIFIPDSPEAVVYAMTRMKFITAFHFMMAINGILGSAIQSYGYATYSTITSIFTVLGFRFIWMQFIYPLFMGNIEMVFLCFNVSWTLDMIFKTTGVIIFRRIFYKKNNVNFPLNAE